MGIRLTVFAPREDERANEVAVHAISGGRATIGRGRDCDLVLPLIFEANIDVNLQGQTVSVQLRAPGTVGGEYYVVLCDGWI